jgi:pimeloyl-ACP methyl ester carboxylesterase
MPTPIRTSILALLITLAALPLTAQEGGFGLPAYDTTWTGRWSGTLLHDGVRWTRISLDITAIVHGPTEVVYSLPDRLLYNRPFDAVHRSGDTIMCTAEEDRITLRAVRDTRTSQMEGVWTDASSTRTLRVGLYDSDDRPQLRSVASAPIERIEKTIAYPKEHVVLGAELVVPRSTTPATRRYPLVVFVSDAGEHDRNASHHGHLPNLIIAERLARAGWASIRWDDRGVGSSTGTLLVAGIPELALEVDHVIKTLGSDPRIDTSRIILLASGEGGLVAAAVAERRPVDHIILLGTPVVDGLSILRDAFDADEAESGTPDHVRAVYRDMLTKWMTAIRLRTDPVGATTAIARIADSIYVATGRDLDSYPVLRRLVDSTRRSYIVGAILPWLQRYAALNPAAVLRPHATNLTLLLAEDDPVVPSRSNAEAYEAITGRQARVIRRTNHFMQSCAACTSVEAGDLTNTVSEDMLDAIVAAALMVR